MADIKNKHSMTLLSTAKHGGYPMSSLQTQQHHILRNSDYLTDYEDDLWQAQDIDQWGNEWENEDEVDADLYYN